MVDSLPTWLRWILLLPISMVGGWAVGYGIYILSASQAAHPNAPIVYIADFAASVTSNLVALYLAYEFAPQFKRQIVAIFVIITVIFSVWTAYLVVNREDLIELIGILGNLVGCVIAWRKYISLNVVMESNA